MKVMKSDATNAQRVAIRSLKSFAPSELRGENGSVCFGKARFTFITTRLVRIEWAADGAFEDRPSLQALRPAAGGVKVSASVRGGVLTARTEHLTLTCCDAEDGLDGVLTVEFRDGSKRCRWRFGQEDTGNLGGSFRTLDNCEAEEFAQWDNRADGTVAIKSTGRRVPVDKGVVSRDGWAWIDDSASVLLEPLPDGRMWAAPRPAGRRVDGFLFAHGHDFRGAVADATLVFGTQPMPPRQAMGYWFSRFWAYTQEEIEEIADRFDRLGLPLDVFVIDMDWHKLGWTGYTWDRQLFPDPAGLLRRLKQRGLALTLNLHPADGVASHEEAYDAVCRDMDIDPRSQQVVPFDCTDPRFMESYFRRLHHPLEKMGVDFWWMDWQQGKETKMAGLDPLHWLARTHWDDQARRRPARRPLNFTRYCGIGSGRMPMAFVGDVFTTWRTLAAQPHFIARAANVLFGCWSTEIGGHLPVDHSPELYTRWMQFGVHSPYCRTHSSKDPRTERRFWQFPEPWCDVLTAALRRRYELVPYLYTEARKQEVTGLSFHRPLYYDWPDEPMAYRSPEIYNLGDAMLAAPVTAPADPKTTLAPVRCWLPSGDWIDTARGEIIRGGSVHRCGYRIEEVPVFVRPGAVIPGQRDVLRLAGGCAPNLEFTCWPGREGGYVLHEDDGVSTAHLDGAFVEIEVCQSTRRGRTEVVIHKAKGSFHGFLEKRPVALRFPLRLPPGRVLLDGRELRFRKDAPGVGWSYEGASCSVVVRLGTISLKQTHRIVFEAGGDDRLTHGAPGRLLRLREISRIARAMSLWKPVHPGERVPAEAALTAFRMTADPTCVAAELTALPERIAATYRAVKTTRESYRRTAKKTGSDYFRQQATNMGPAVALASVLIKHQNQSGRTHTTQKKENK